MPGNITFIDNSTAVLEAKDQAIAVALEAIGHQAESHAKRNLKKAGAVDTGRLRNSIAHRVVEDEETVYIGTNVKYAPYVEHGTGIFADNGMGRKDGWVYQDDKGKWHFTRGQKPVHFLRDAAQNHAEEYKNIAKKYMKNTP